MSRDAKTTEQVGPERDAPARKRGGKRRRPPEKIGFLRTSLIGIGGSIGGGIIFLVLGTALDAAGPGLLVSWLVGGVLSVSIALNYSELATSLPVVGGGYSFLKEALGGVLAFLLGFYMLVANIGFSAFNAYGFAISLRELFPPLDAVKVPVALAVLCAFLVVALRFGSGTPRQQARVGLVLLAFFAVFLVAGFALGPVLNASNFSPSRLDAPVEPLPVFQMVAVLFAAFVSFEFLFGFESLVTIYEEVENPQKNVPRANLVAVLFSLCLYLAVTVVVILNVDFRGTYAGQNALAMALGGVLGPFGSIFMTVAAAFACITSLFAAMVNSSRILYALARDHYFPPIFKKLNSKTGLSPWGLVATAGVVIAFVLVGQMDVFLEVADFGFLVGLVFINVSVIVLRQRREYLDRPFKTKWYPYLPVLSAAFCLVLAAQLTPRAIATGSAVGAIALVVYAIRISRRRDRILVLGGLKLFCSVLSVVFLAASTLDFNPLLGDEATLEMVTRVLFYSATIVTLLTFVLDLVPLSRGFRWWKERAGDTVVQVAEAKLFAFSEDEERFINRFNHVLGALQLVAAGITWFLFALVINRQVVVGSATLLGAVNFPPEFMHYSTLVFLGVFGFTLLVGGLTAIYLEWERSEVSAY
ncbi:MAG: hypothetical protein Kow0069_36530 [Promethearchaeota archaeon]